MISLLDPFFWIGFVGFFLAILLTFYVPGDVLVGKLKISSFQKFVISVIVGMALWGWQGFLFGYLNVRFLTYIYLFIFFIIWVYRKRKKVKLFKKINWQYSKRNIDFVVVLLVLLGLFIQLAPVWGFGLKFDKGLFLCCGNREDLLYHLSLVSSIINGMPPIEPGFSGALVQNYHYWSNLVIAEMARIFHLPIFYLEFQYVTLFVSLFLGLSVVTFSSLLYISKNFTRWLVFLIYFGGDGILFLLLILGKGLKEFKLMSSLEDGSTFLVNPPRAFSLVVAMVGLSLLNIWIKQKNYRVGILTMVVFASTIGFKVYTGFFALAGFSFLSLYFLYKREFKNVLITLLIYPLTAVIYFSNNSEAGGLLWVPLYIVNNFIVQPSLGLTNLELARQIYIAHKSYIRILEYELIFMLISLPALFGTKILAFLQSPKSSLRMGGGLLVFLLSGIFVSLFIGLFFLQKTGGSNTFNFIVSAWFFLSIFAALALEYLQKKFSLGFIFIIIILLLTVPRVSMNTYLNIVEYKKFDYRFVTNQELSAFKFIRDNTSDKALISVDPDNGFDRYTPYFSVFTQRPMYLSGEHILESHGIDANKRKSEQENIFKNSNVLVVAKSLLGSKIDYLLLWEKDHLPATESSYFTTKVFNNKEMSLLRINMGLAKRYIKNNGN